ncbi:unnamed protein product [Ambrosiozyma monospora]|uniref:High osmolarity signaling protein SHO1 n=1 Tax=Ambrosiozyma monospora TaxID=43982 RepID=A0A9W6YRS2_AMBMO|nr:unnamed protein product [Ambrosiozyma monospora]
MARQSNKISLFNPFALGTFIIACMAWVLAFACSIASSRLMTYYPKFSWWGLVYQLLLLIMVAIVYTTNTFHCYRFFLSSSIAVAFVYNSNSANNLIYIDQSACQAASAGFILLCITNWLWLFYFGSEPDSPIISYIDSFGNGGNVMLATKQTMNSRRTVSSGAYKDEAGSVNAPLNAIPTTVKPNPFETVAQQSYLKGMEKKSDNVANRTTLTVDPEYPIFVKGLYDYEASPDENELSFKKGEIFRVKDTKGNWWQAKNSLGEVGMCPSNYLDVIN